MEHDRIKDWLYLSVFDELNEDERRHVEKHIESCDECRREREALLRMLAVIEASGAGEPSEEMLMRARHNLSAALSKEPAPRPVAPQSARRESFLSRLTGAGPKRLLGATWSGWRGGARLALAGAAVLCVGFFFGYIAFGGTQAPVSVPALEPGPPDSFAGISNVQFLDADAADGEVEILYDEVRPVRLRAPMDDQRMRQVMAHAILYGSNPGVRLEAMNAYETVENVTPQGDVKDAFLEALVSDPNAGVRRQALLVLQRMPFDDDIKRALLFVLSHDQNPGLRIAAMNYLTAYMVDGVIPESEYRDILDAGNSANWGSFDRNRFGTD